MTELHKAVQTGIGQGKKVEALQASISLPGTISTASHGARVISPERLLIPAGTAPASYQRQPATAW